MRIPYNTTEHVSDLLNLELPKPQGPRHHPLAHVRAWSVVAQQVEEHGMEIENQRFWTQHAPHLEKPVDKCLMLLTLKAHESDPKGTRRMIGIRNSNDQTWSLQAVAGHQIMVCSNGMFEGEFKALTKKHTTNIEEHLEDAVREGFHSILDGWTAQEKFIKKMRACQPMQAYDVPSMLYDVSSRLEETVLPEGKFGELVELTVNPPHEEFEPCSVWAGHNAFTELLKSESSPNKPLRSRHINRAFDGHIEDFPSYLDYQHESAVPSFVKTMRDYS
jgi:hypothetical protein